MKKTVFFTLAVFVMSMGLKAQDYTDRDKFKFGLNAGLPIGDAGDISNISLGLDLAYHYGVSKAIDLGLATGFTNAFVNTVEIAGVQTEFDNVQFLPLAGAFRIYPTVRSRVNFGTDLGYAVGINDGNDGGFYYRPTLAINIGRGTELTASYTGVSLDGGSWDTVTAGVLFGF